MSERMRCASAFTFTVLAILLHAHTLAVPARAGSGDPASAAHAGYELSIANPTARQTIGADVDRPQVQKFVQIEVTQVRNPRRIALSFDVDFRPAQGEDISLGSFSLYPADNPGKFIIATRGSLRAGGVVRVTLVPLQRGAGEEQIRVRLAPLSFRPD